MAMMRLGGLLRKRLFHALDNLTDTFLAVCPCSCKNQACHFFPKHGHHGISYGSLLDGNVGKLEFFLGS